MPIWDSAAAQPRLIKAGIGGPWEPIRKESQGEEERNDSRNYQLKVNGSHSTKGPWLKRLHQPSFSTNSPNTGREPEEFHTLASIHFLPQVHPSLPIKVQVVSLDEPCRKLQEHAIRATGPVGWKTYPMELCRVLLTQQPCYQLRITPVNQITRDSWSFV